MRGGMYDSWTLLHAAAQKGHAAHVALLLSHGAPTDAANKKGDTPLSKAVGRAAAAASASAATPPPPSGHEEACRRAVGAEWTCLRCVHDASAARP